MRKFLPLPAFPAYLLANLASLKVALHAQPKASYLVAGNASNPFLLWESPQKSPGTAANIDSRFCFSATTFADIGYFAVCEKSLAFSTINRDETSFPGTDQGRHESLNDLVAG